METEFKLYDVISSEFALIKKKSIGKQNLRVIKSNSCNAEDAFQDNILFLLENFGDHSSSISHDDELCFIQSKLREKHPRQHKQVVGVEYFDNHDNTFVADNNDKGYFDKLQLLLVHYQPVCLQ